MSTMLVDSIKPPIEHKLGMPIMVNLDQIRQLFQFSKIIIGKTKKSIVNPCFDTKGAKLFFTRK